METCRPKSDLLAAPSYLLGVNRRQNEDRNNLRSEKALSESTHLKKVRTTSERRHTESLGILPFKAFKNGANGRGGLLGIGLTCGLKVLISGERHHVSFPFLSVLQIILLNKPNTRNLFVQFFSKIGLPSSSRDISVKTACPALR